MVYLLIDDEKIILEGMKDTLLLVVNKGDTILTASDPFEATELMKQNNIDIIFSDVDMPGMNGLKLAQIASDIVPDADIVFCTGYAHYSLDAWKTEAKAFILKPVTEEDLAMVINKLMADRAKRAGGAMVPRKKKLEARCFGNFELFYEGTPVHFARKKSKEMIAYLIDRKGAMISTGEIRTALWSEDEDSEEKKGYIRVLANDIRKSMEDIGVTDFLKNDMDCYSVNTSDIDCDYFRFLEGDEAARNSFADEYMVQYDWAEVTLSSLLNVM